MSSYDQATALRFLEKWTHRQLGSLDHEHRVASIANSLIEVTGADSRLNGRHRRLLMWAAIVHDVGRSVEDQRHPQIGAKLIDAAVALPIDKSDRRALCYLTRYHRGAVPRIGKDDYLKGHDDRKQLYLGIAYLRSADALDNRNMESPRLIFKLDRNGLNITVQPTVESNKFRRVYTRRQKFKLLEELLSIQINVELVCEKIISA